MRNSATNFENWRRKISYQTRNFRNGTRKISGNIDLGCAIYKLSSLASAYTNSFNIEYQYMYVINKQMQQSIFHFNVICCKAFMIQLEFLT
jgi:hypothetical protein